MHPNLKRALVAVVLAAALAMIVVSFSLGVTDDGTMPGLPAQVEAVTPQRGAQVQRQTEVIADLASGYYGTLVINGTTIPGDQYSFDPGQNQLIFPCRLADAGAPSPAAEPSTTTPSASTAGGSDSGGVVAPVQPPCARNVPGAELYEPPKGSITATVVYWLIADGPGVNDRSYTWSFTTF